MAQEPYLEGWTAAIYAQPLGAEGNPRVALYDEQPVRLCKRNIGGVLWVFNFDPVSWATCVCDLEMRELRLRNREFVPNGIVMACDRLPLRAGIGSGLFAGAGDLSIKASELQREYELGVEASKAEVRKAEPMREPDIQAPAPRKPMTLEAAHAIIVGLMRAKRSCDRCERISLDSAASMFRSLNEAAIMGWQLSADATCYIRPCTACMDSELYPWAKCLDPVAVKQYMDSRPEGMMSAEDFRSIVGHGNNGD